MEAHICIFSVGEGDCQGMVTSIRMVTILVMVAVLGIPSFLKNGDPTWYSYNA